MPDKNTPSSRYFRFILIGLTLIALILACNKPASTPAPESEGDPIGTSVQETHIAQTVQAQSGGQTDEQQSGEQSPQPPAASDTPGPSATISLTPEPSETPTPETPLVHVSADTNCRIGPGKPYKREGALTVGEEAEIVARDPSGQYWYIRNPDRPSAYCWVWGYYATPEGNTDSLPVFTPPPTPTFTSTPTFTPTPTPDLNFKFTYTETGDCGGNEWRVYFKITNNGGFTLQSVSTTVTDNDTVETVTYTKDQFEELDAACILGGAHNDLTAGEVGYTTSDSLTVAVPTGHDIDATIKVCTEIGLGGDCITKTLNFTP
ncbi:MAG: hypothetical protein U9Q82_07290 [Chloroflexota bacterium]|nr:hypothetical protein [Chloroflexota bacterium]